MTKGWSKANYNGKGQASAINPSGRGVASTCKHSDARVSKGVKMAKYQWFKEKNIP